MPDHPSAADGTTRRPFREQLAFFRAKLARQLPTERWDDLTRAEHDTAFVVAGATKADLLSDLAAAVDRAIAEGKSLEAFRQDFEAAVKANGWHGWTGEDTKGGRAWRTRTIYRTNATTSYAAGRYAQLVEGGYPLWVYRHGNSTEPRPEHLELDGLVLRADHPFWSKYYPPSDWGCSCYVLGARTMKQALRLGGKPDLVLPDWWDKTDPATGAPPGIGKGWDYPPGASVASAIASAAGKIESWDHRIAKGYMEGLPAEIRDRLSHSYRSLPSVAADARRYAREAATRTDDKVDPSHTLGLVTSDTVAAFDEIVGESVDLFDFALDRSAIGHIAREHGDPATEAQRGQRGVVADDYAMLPAIVSHGELRDGDLPGRVQIVLRRGGVEYVTVWERRAKRRSLALVTMYIRIVKGAGPPA